MKHIPIVINNRDRLKCLIQLILSFLDRGYTNITILDNGSNEPLLEWYNRQKIAKNIL